MLFLRRFCSSRTEFQELLRKSRYNAMLEPYDLLLQRRIAACDDASAALEVAKVEDKAFLAQQLGQLSPVAQLARRRSALLSSVAELEQLGSAADLRADALAEAAAAAAELDGVSLALVRALAPGDDGGSAFASGDAEDGAEGVDVVLLELRAGTGGAEAALFTAELLRMYRAYALGVGWVFEAGGAEADEEVREVSAEVRGEGALRLRVEAGVHRVQRIPRTETMGRVHTSTATCAVMPLPKETELRLDPRELRVDTYRSSGKGGQHVNKTESAVRVTHLPTQTVVAIQDERSQHRNRDRAMGILRARLLEKKREEERARRDGARRGQIGSGGRSERIRTYNFPQSRVTDHRLQKTVHDIEAMMQGELLDEFIEEMIEKEMEANLKEAFRKEIAEE